MYHQALAEINKADKKLYQNIKRMYYHLLGFLLLQNGDCNIASKLKGFTDKFEELQSLGKNNESDILNYIKMADGRIFEPKEARVIDILRSEFKDYKLAEEILLELNPDSMYAASLYNLAILNYLKYDNRPESMQTGLEYSIKAAEKGNNEAALTAGHQLLNGVPGFSKELNGLLEFRDEKAAVLGFFPYPDDIKTEIDTERAVVFLNIAVNGGNKNACEVLAKYYAEHGEPQKAIDLLSRAAIDYGSNSAAEAMGDYFSGRAEKSRHTFLKKLRPIHIDNREAIRNWYSPGIDNNRVIIPKLLDTIFASENPADYMDILSKVYSIGEIPQWGFEHLKEFIATGEAKEISRDDFLGICYFGPILSRNLNKAYSLLLQGYNAGRKTGYTVYLLGILHLSKIEGLPKDPVKAHHLFMEAADLGFDPAAALAGKSCYDGGRGFFPGGLVDDGVIHNSEAQMSVKFENAFSSPEKDQELNLKNPGLAEKYLKQAADAGFEFCCIILAGIYLKQGKANEGYAYTQKASWYGSGQASLQLAVLHAGVNKMEYPPDFSVLSKAADVQKDYSQALFYCDLANIQGGQSDYHMRLADLFVPGDTNPEDLKFINTLLEKAAELGEKAAVIKLGLNYMEGICCKKDEKKAFALLTSMNDGIQPHISDCIYDSVNSVDYGIEIRRAQALARIYGSSESDLYNAGLSEEYDKLADNMIAKKKEIEDMFSDMLSKK